MWCIKRYNAKNLLKVDKLTAWTQQKKKHCCNIILADYFWNNFHRLMYIRLMQNKKRTRRWNMWVFERNKNSTAHVMQSMQRLTDEIFQRRNWERSDKVLDEHLLYCKTHVISLCTCWDCNGCNIHNNNCE